MMSHPNSELQTVPETQRVISSSFSFSSSSVVLQGQTGAPGFSGDFGERGYIGYHGQAGGRGELGLKGTKGQDGLPGSHGEPGEDGLTGVPGLAGESGQFGPKGSKGDVGVRGPRGRVGLVGSQGEQGNAGVPGKHGPKGLQGQPEAKGELGTNGEKVQRDPRDLWGSLVKAFQDMMDPRAIQDFRVTLENPRSAWTAPGAPGDSPARWAHLEAWDRQECLGSVRHVTAASMHQ